MATKKKNTTTSKTSNRNSSAKKTNNTSKNKSNKSSSSGKKTNSNKAKSTRDNYIEEPIDPFFEDSTKEIILWVSIAICILLLISNFGLGGIVGNAVAGFLFGVFGILQYIMPLLVAFTAFFLISNYGNKVAIAKVIAGFILVIFTDLLIELLIHGESMLDPISIFEESKLTHNGGGIIAGTIATFLYDSFSLFGTYIIDLIVIVVCVIIIFEHFAFDKVQSSSRYRSDKQAAKRRLKREKMMLEREANQTRYNEERKAIRAKVEQDINDQLNAETNDQGPRRDRKHSGITINTTLTPDVSTQNNTSDGINEIKFNIDDNNVNITQTTRHKLHSNDISSSSHRFNLPSEDNNNTTIDDSFNNKLEVNESENITKFSPKINKPIETVFNTDSTKEEEPIPTRHAKASVVSKEETEKEVNNLRDQINTEKKKIKKPYKFPPLNLLNENKKSGGDSKEYLTEMAGKLQRTLSNFGVSAQVTEVTPGPSVTRYEISIAEGTKVSKVVNLSDDIKLSMAVTDVRIEAPIPGKSAIGIEVPNKEKTLVGFRELVSSKDFKDTKSKISFCVGKDISGQVIVGNIEKMPHLLIAGATGSGKSVCINTVIMSILYHASPDDVKMIMVDPKMVELSVYNGIPHLLIPVVTDAKKAAGALHWAVKEMTDRYELLAMAGVRNIESFNEKVATNTLPDEIPEGRREKLPQLIVILDELADLMMVAAADVEDSIVRLAQLARAAGIHLIIATQRPTSNVITGLIKANVPSRIAFSVSSSVDSRVILDMNGAEDLLGNGDMLYAPQNLSKPIRVQGAFVSEEEVARVVDYLKDNNDSADYDSNIEEQIQKVDSSSTSTTITGEIDNSKDPLFGEAGKLVIENQKGSIGYLQRNFRIGFNRAARIMDQLAESGVVGPEMGTKPREIKMSISEFEELISNM